MSDVIWSDRDRSRVIVQRLLGRDKRTNAIVSSGSEYTRLTARSSLERRGRAPASDETSSRRGRSASSERPGVPSVKPPPNAELAEEETGGEGRLPPPAIGLKAKETVIEERFLSLNTENVDTLEALLDWTLSCAKASSAFLLDAQGFIVERVGKWEFDLAEATGTQVLLAMERLGKTELTETTLRSLNVEFDDHWLTAVPLPAGHDETYTLCLVTTAAMSPALVRHLSGSVAEVILRV
jgi:hypothetical protein